MFRIYVLAVVVFGITQLTSLYVSCDLHGSVVMTVL